MTQKRVLTVDFKDIKSLEVTCALCGAKFTLPVPKDALSWNVACVGCNTRLWDGPDDREFQVVSGLLLMLSQVQRHDDKVFRLGFSLNADTHE
ncbi:MAG TPA: hypothetical protein VGT24_13220 [Candidatus Acidoferrales bacterium]|nr:hypothetical protein [Candidatus Acidoferrales bacterium]